jgi:putative transposase
MDAPRRAEGAKFLMQEGVKARRACQIVGISTASPYRKPPPDKDAVLRQKLKATWRPNMGYRMAHALVKPETAPLNVKRVHRIWKEEKLGPMKRYRKRRTGQTVPLSASHPNHVWCVDFIFDSCLNGTKLKILAVKDEVTKECLALEVRTRFRSVDVRRVLESCFEAYGVPQKLRSDNGSEFVARSLAVFLNQSGSGAHFIKPGSPWQNAFIESFNSRLRAECLDVEVFYNLADAQVKLAIYRRWYNEERPHSTLDDQPPAVFRSRYSDAGWATPSLHPNIAKTQPMEKKL